MKGSGQIVESRTTMIVMPGLLVAAGRFWKTCLTSIKRPPLRQTEGFLYSVLTLMGLAFPWSDHTTLSRRNVRVAVRRQAWKYLHMGVDAQGGIIASTTTDGHEQDPPQVARSAPLRFVQQSR
jgi:hypothetical protein